MAKEVTLNIPEISREAGTFATTYLVLRDIRKDYKMPDDDLACLSLSAFFLLPQHLPQYITIAFFYCFLDGVTRRVVHSKTGDIVFPPWDESQKELLDLYRIADAFLCFEAWSLSFGSSLPPESHFGPLFSIAGHILTAVEGAKTVYDSHPESFDVYRNILYHGRPQDKREHVALVERFQGVQSMIKEFFKLQENPKTE